MARSTFGAWGFVLAGVLFLVAGVGPVLRGDRLNAAFVALAVVFMIVGAAAMKRRAAVGGASRR
jgi:hypothetical protein